MIKRGIDIFVATTALLILSPILLIIACFVRINLGSPILFCQPRPGMSGKPFDMVKFRTMQNIQDQNGDLLPDSERMTSLGRFLRTSSLDELPELFNVLKGDMSLVGPRPLLMEYLPLYSERQHRRHEVRPGITGWAQINGRNAVDWEEKFNFDVWYVDNRSLSLDLKILILTVWKVLACEGISAEGEVSMPRFIGSAQGEK